MNEPEGLRNDRCCLLLLEVEATVPLADYLTAIGTTAGGLAMGGLAQALRLLLEINP